MRERPVEFSDCKSHPESKADGNRNRTMPVSVTCVFCAVFGTRRVTARFVDMMAVACAKRSGGQKVQFQFSAQELTLQKSPGRNCDD